MISGDHNQDKKITIMTWLEKFEAALIDLSIQKEEKNKEDARLKLLQQVKEVQLEVDVQIKKSKKNENKKSSSTLEGLSSASQSLSISSSSNQLDPAAFVEYADYYFQKSIANYLFIISILKEYAKLDPLVLITHVAKKNNTDIHRIGIVLSEIDSRRFVPRIFHCYLQQRSDNMRDARYYMKGYESCYQLARVVFSYLTQLQNEIDGGLLYTKFKNRFGHKIAKIITALVDRIHRYEVNQELVKIKTTAESNDSTLKKLTEDIEKNPNNLLTHLNEIEKRLDEMLAAEKFVAIPEFILDESSDQLKLTNYLENFTSYLRTHPEYPAYTEFNFVVHMHAEVEARNVPLGNSYVYMGDLVKNVNQAVAEYGDIENHETWKLIKNKLKQMDDKVRQEKVRIEGNINIWGKEIHDLASAIKKSLQAAYGQFDPETAKPGFFTSEADIAILALAKNAFDEIAPVYEMTKSHHTIYEWALEEIFKEIVNKLINIVDRYQEDIKKITPKKTTKKDELLQLFSNTSARLHIIKTWDSYQTMQKCSEMNSKLNIVSFNTDEICMKNKF